MPDPIRFLINHALVGFIAAIIFVGAIMAVNLASLRTLVVNSDVGFLAVLLLTGFVGLTFASVQMGVAIMQLTRESGRTRHRE